MTRSYTFLIAMVLLSTLGFLPPTSAGSLPFMVAVLIKEGTVAKETCTSEELATIEASMQFHMVQRGNKHFGTSYDFELVGDLIDMAEDDFDNEQLENLASAAYSGGFRRLKRGYKFVYGGKQAWMCRFCDRDRKDGRRLLGGHAVEIQKDLLKAMTDQVGKDVAADYADYFLDLEGTEYGCLGDGTTMSIVFELNEDWWL